MYSGTGLDVDRGIHSCPVFILQPSGYHHPSDYVFSIGIHLFCKDYYAGRCLLRFGSKMPEEKKDTVGTATGYYHVDEYGEVSFW